VKTLYLDIFSGLSGDMFLGALLDLGVELPALERELKKLKLDGYHLHAMRRQKSGIEGVKFDVHVEGDGHDHDCDHPHQGEHEHSEPHSQEHHHHDRGEHAAHLHAHEKEHEHEHEPKHDHDHDHGHEHDGSRDFAQVRQLITASSLSPWVKEKAIATFHRIAVAEGKIHGHPPDEVHFHEVGAVDSIVDIVGVCIGLEMLGRPRVLAAPVVEGTGFVRCAHGRFPLPAPATLEILGARGVAITQCEEPSELLTPTGAALLAEFAESFAPISGLVADRVGYGLGTRDNQSRPNVVRAVLTRDDPSRSLEHDWETDQIAVLETNLDDVSAEILGHVAEKALRLGALDVFQAPVQMKKNRPGVVFTVLCADVDADRFTELLLVETSAFGVRRTFAERRKLRRETREVATSLGKVIVKIGRMDGKIVQIAPEYESCRGVAAMSGAPLREVYEAALSAARAALG
jgi:uncharacterized protein (TIGR00299 family) protein